MPTVMHRGRPSMGTWFEAWLVGDDDEHLAAVAEAALDEVERVERLLSRHDPCSELSRVNREAVSGPVRVGYELLAVLQTCRAGWERTHGFFDPTASAAGIRTGFDAVAIDVEQRRVRFLDRRLTLDLGGFGKGYALDRALEVLNALGVKSALFHGGTSSVAALGRDADSRPWSVGIRDLFAEQRPAIADGPRLALCDRTLSCSAVFGDGAARSDLIDPGRGRPLDECGACLVLDGSAAEAEIASTGLLAMGKARARRYAEREAREGLAIAWFAPGEEPEWLTGAP